ncbi:hypothetical protein V8B97DRAFT_2024130 [Scleroderma yunnanense]
MNLIYSQGPSQHWGSATWIARALKIQQAQRTDTRVTETQMLSIAHWHDQLQSQINSLIESAAKAPLILLGGGDANGDVFMLTQLELELRQGQANDCLHELQLALADKAHVAMYSWCHDQMMELNRSDLKVSTAVTDPNARGYRDDTLVWFWTMDVPWDTATENWMSEYMLFWSMYLGHVH